MILKAIIDDQEYSLNVPEAIMQQGEDFFAKLDADMDKGWQMSREWVQHPNQVERCQIVADKLLTALEKENHKLGMLMAGYILSRMPQVDKVEIDIRGEIQNTEFISREPEAAAFVPTAATGSDATESKEPIAPPEAHAQADSEVSQVFKMGKGYCFSVFDPDSGSWRNSPMIATEEDAQRLRQEAFNERLDALSRSGRLQ